VIRLVGVSHWCGLLDARRCDSWLVAFESNEGGWQYLGGVLDDAPDAFALQPLQLSTESIGQLTTLHGVSNGLVECRGWPGSPQVQQCGDQIGEGRVARPDAAVGLVGHSSHRPLPVFVGSAGQQATACGFGGGARPVKACSDWVQHGPTGGF
jgi:hypothetical protein